MATVSLSATTLQSILGQVLGQVDEPETDVMYFQMCFSESDTTMCGSCRHGHCHIPQVQMFPQEIMQVVVHVHREAGAHGASKAGQWMPLLSPTSLPFLVEPTKATKPLSLPLPPPLDTAIQNPNFVTQIKVI